MDLQLPEVSEVKRVGVLGAGTMGAGWIAQLVSRGVEVVCGDKNPEALAGLDEKVEGLLRSLVKKGALAEDAVAPALELITCLEEREVDDILAAMAGHEVSIFLEVVFENLGVKREVFGSAGEAFPPQVVFWSNTSTLLCQHLGEASGRPRQTINTHGMNPVPLMPCVEVVPSKRTSDEVREWTLALLKHWGKTPFLAPDIPGFSVNRICIPMWNAATSTIGQALSTVEDLDTGLKGSVGFPQGVLMIQDLIGLDVMLLATAALNEQTHDPRFEPPHLLRKMVAAGQLGKKTGRGFYDWSTKPPTPVPLEELLAL